MIIGTLTTGDTVVTTFTLQYVPAYLTYVAATQLTSIKVNVAGDGIILDLDSTGLSDVNSIRKVGQVTNGYMIPLANGFIPNKVTEITVVNSATQTPVVYGASLQTGTYYIVTRRQILLANSPVVIDKFANLGIASPTDDDEITVTFKNGHVQKFEYEELAFWLSLYTNYTSLNCIDNTSGFIDQILYIPSTNRTVYITKYLPIGNISG